MKKNIILLGAITISSLAFSQVGINTETPQATLDVAVKTTGTNLPEGIIAPRLTGDDIKSRDTLYDTPQKGAIVYATAPVGTASTKTANITSEGYYYFDGTIWTKFGSGTVAAGTEPWYNSAGNVPATANTQNIYQMGKVGINKSTVPTSQLDVTGDLKANYANGGVNNGINTNYVGLGVPANIIYVADNEDLLSATNSSIVFVTPDLASIQSNKTTGGGSISAYSTTNGGNVGMYANNTVANTTSSIWGYNSGTQSSVQLSHSKNGAENTTVELEKLSGVSFNFLTSAGAFEGKYTFPRNNGLANQVLTTDGAVGLNAQLSWKNVSDLIQNNDWHITGNAGTTAGTNFLGTTDAQALMFKVNGQQSGYISDNATNTVGATGLYKTTLGYQAGMQTTGDRITAIGNLALRNNTAQNNTGIGAFALTANTTGTNNMAVGDNTLVNNTTGSRNAAIGSTALQINVTGNNNTGNGYRAGRNTTGSDNTFIGNLAGFTNTTGANNTAVGSEADVISTGLTNATAIGYNAKVAQSNSMVLGGTGANAVNVGIGVTAPSNALHVVATADPLKLEGLQAGTATDEVLVVNNNVVKKVTAGSLASSLEPWQNQSDATKATSNTAAIYQVGNVSIGTQAPITPFTSNGATITPKLSVTGDVATTGSYYTTTGKYADYVFEDYLDGASKINENYKFKSLQEIAEYIKVNKHLPGVTSINDIPKTKEGYTVNLSELSIQQLEKIEELYLHTIEQQEEIAKQKKELEDMRSRMEKLEKLLLKASDNK